MAPGCPAWHWKTGGARETVVEMENSIGMRWGLLKPKLRMKVVVCCCWFHVLSVSFSGFYGYELALNSLYDDFNEPTGLNETKSDLGGPPYLVLSAGVAGRDGVRGPMALLSCVAKAEVWTISGRIHVITTCRSLTKSL